MAPDACTNNTQDRRPINTTEPWEIKYWTQRFGVSEKELKDAVFAVGVMSDDVKTYLGKQ